MAEPTPRLQIDGLRVSYGDLLVLDGLSLTVGPGEIFGLLGPNGSGKSTTFSVLTGLLKPSAGTFQFEGRTVTPGEREFRTQLGVVFQKPSLDPTLTGRENLQMTAQLYGVPRAEAGARISALLEFADLVDRADEPVKQLSGGMCRRLELARSMVHAPRLLIMDEPTTGLDEASFQRTWQRLRRLRDEQGLSILLSTHRPEEAAFCDRLAMINKGVVVACDTPAALQAQVSGDVITVSGKNPKALWETLVETFAVTPRAVEGGVAFRCDDGHKLIPRLVEAFPAGRLDAVHLQQPSLADVFIELTGATLLEDEA